MMTLTGWKLRTLIAALVVPLVALGNATESQGQAAPSTNKAQDAKTLDTNDALRKELGVFIDEMKFPKETTIDVHVVSGSTRDTGTFQKFSEDLLKTLLEQKKLKVTFDPDSTAPRLTLDYTLQPAPRSKSKDAMISLKYQIENFHPDGVDIPPRMFGRKFRLTDLNSILPGNAVTADLKAAPKKNNGPNYSPDEPSVSVGAVINQNRDQPSVALRSRPGTKVKSLVSPSADSDFAVEIRVKNNPLVPEERSTDDGGDGIAHVRIPRGEYTLVLYNMTDYDAYAAVSIDGINTQRFADNKDGSPPGLYYVVKKENDPRNPEGIEIKGWYKDGEKAKAFVIGDFEKSAAGQAGIPPEDSNVGTITVVFGLAYIPGATKAPDEPSSKGSGAGSKGKVATAIGGEVKAHSEMLTREFGIIRSSITIHYEEDTGEPAAKTK